jgi:hypothetical protein
MESACLRGQTRELQQLASWPTWTGGAKRKRNGGKIFGSHLLQIHLPWACDGMSTLGPAFKAKM